MRPTFGAGTVTRRGSRHTPGNRVMNAVFPTSATVSAVVLGRRRPSRAARQSRRRSARTARPIGTCAAFHSPASPRMLIRMSVGIWYGTSSDVSALIELPRPLDCSITVGRLPPRYRPAAMPNASSSRVAIVVRDVRIALAQHAAARATAGCRERRRRGGCRRRGVRRRRRRPTEAARETKTCVGVYSRYHPVAMSLPPGTRLGSCEIQSAIGAGGMGEVYRARDTKLNRDVAIKVLPAAFRRRSRAPGAFRTRGPGARVAEPSQHRADLRRRRHGRMSGLVMELVAGRRRSTSASQRGPMPWLTGALDRATDCRRARSCPRTGHRPSRSEACKHQGASRRRRESARFRPRESD